LTGPSNPTTPTFLGKWGSPGSGNGQFNRPYGAAVDATGNIYVSDIFNHRIQKFDKDGVYLDQWGSLGLGNGQFNRSGGVALDSAGNVYVADGLNHRIQKFDASGTYIDQWGSLGSGDGQFNLPTGVALDAAERSEDWHVYCARLTTADS
jgi:DNA-binding beta-propeller fold protein YncE